MRVKLDKPAFGREVTPPHDGMHMQLSELHTGTVCALAAADRTINSSWKKSTGPE